MIDHFSIAVRNYELSLKFYDETLSILSYKRLHTIDLPAEGVKVAGYGAEDKPSFWISPMGLPHEDIGKAKGVHLAFQAPNADTVRRWYKKALELGAKDNGPPGPRKEYHPGYYGAFVVDPDGWRLEAVFHGYQG